MNNLYDLIIIGAGPAGISAAIYAGRAKLRTLILDSDQGGGQIGITDNIVNYPGIISISGAELTSNMRRQAENFDVEIKTEKVVDLDLSNTIKQIKTSEGNTYSAVGIVVATGARPKTLGFPGEKEYTGRGIGYCATCDGEFFTGMDIFVIGGGFAAAEEAIFLTRYAKKVHIMVRRSEFGCSGAIVDQVNSNDKIEVHYNTELVEVGGDDVLRSAKFKNNETGEIWDYKPDSPDETFGLFIFVGYEPINELVKEHIGLNETGYIPTDEDMLTNVEGVYAAGDIRPKRLRQLATAVSDGAIAATAAEKYIERIKAEHNIEVKKVEEESKEEDSASSHSSFLDDGIIAGLQPILDRFENPITLLVVGNEEQPGFSSELKSFADDIAGLSDMVTVSYLALEDYNKQDIKIKSDLFPVLAVLDKDSNDLGIYFNGIPGGHEFNSFILAIYNAAGPGQQIPENTLARIKALPPQLIQVGATLSCTMCPDAVQAAQLIARHNPNITAQMIDISKFPEFREKHKIMSVPAVIVNEASVSFGRKDLETMLALLEK